MERVKMVLTRSHAIAMRTFLVPSVNQQKASKLLLFRIILLICFVPAEGVDNAIRITTHPQNVTAELNQQVILTFRAESEALINYEWIKDDVPIGPMSNSLIIRDISPSDRGVYICRASTATNSTNSTPALVTIRGMIIAEIVL